jgi:tetratricopeptide (TPR) repeat protein
MEVETMHGTRHAAILFFTVLTSCFFYSGSPAQVRDEEKLYNYGQMLVKLGEKGLFQQTVRALQDYLILFPDSTNAADVQMDLADTYREQNEEESAFVAYLKALTLYPGSSRVVRAANLAKMEISDSRSLRPIQEKLYSIVDTPDTADSLSNRYHALLYRLRQLIYPKLNDALIQECRLFLDTYPDHPRSSWTCEWLGDMMREKGKNWQALDAYLRVTAFHPDAGNLVDVQLKTGNLYGNALKRYEESLDLFKAVVESDADSLTKGEAVWKMAQVLDQKVKDYQGAVDQYGALITKYPSHTQVLPALIRKAELESQKLKRYERAVETYHSIAVQFPELDEARESLLKAVDIYKNRIKDYEKTITTYRELAVQFSSDSEAPVWLYKAAEIAEKELEDMAWAMGLYREVIERFPSDRMAERAERKVQELGTEQNQ